MSTKILFISTNQTTFIKRDLNFLRTKFAVNHFIFNNKPIKDFLLIPRFFSAVKQCDITFTWFASRFALLAVIASRIFCKKSVVILAGYEVAYLPEIKYGGIINLFSKKIVYLTIKYADRVLAVDPGLRENAIEIFGQMAKRIQILPTGYDDQKFTFDKNKKENIVLTICKGNNMNRAKLKGLDIFLEVATILPKINFYIIGMSGKGLMDLQEKASANVKFIGELTENELIKFLHKAKVYCQFSMREGLPNSVCEAMLCGCIPVGSNVQGIKTAIGDAGFLVKYGDIKASRNAVNLAISEKRFGIKPRKRIQLLFTQKKRELGLVQTIESLVGND